MTGPEISTERGSRSGADQEADAPRSGQTAAIEEVPADQDASVDKPSSADEATGQEDCCAAFLAAVGFLTRIPVRDSSNPQAGLWQRSLVYFPLVGALTGCATTMILGGFGLLWPVLPAVLLALTAEIMLTGGLHEDGLADCCDGFGGGWTREDVLRIMKDSRVGTFGVLALILGVGLKASLIYYTVTAAGFEQWWLWGSVLMAATAISRWTMVMTLSLIPPVDNRQSLSARYATRLPAGQLTTSIAWTIAAAAPYAVFLPVSFTASVAMCVIAVSVLLRFFRRRLDGVTGDCLGCVGYIAQLAVLSGGAIRIESWTG